MIRKHIVAELLSLFKNLVVIFNSFSSVIAHGFTLTLSHWVGYVALFEFGAHFQLHNNSYCACSGIHLTLWKKCWSLPECDMKFWHVSTRPLIHLHAYILILDHLEICSFTESRLTLMSPFRTAVSFEEPLSKFFLWLKSSSLIVLFSSYFPPFCWSIFSISKWKTTFGYKYSFFLS